MVSNTRKPDKMDRYVHQHQKVQMSNYHQQHATRTLGKSVQRLHTHRPSGRFSITSLDSFFFSIFYVSVFWVHSAAQERLVIGQDGFD